jgi:inner membrane protein
MDNVTHTIAGFLLAEGLVQLRRKRLAAISTVFARSAYAISALGNNLPDLDFGYTMITQPQALGYVLHHRGYTHTFLGGTACMALLLLIFGVLAKQLRTQLQPGERAWLLGLGLLGPVLHVCMDYSNNYGVHPLWPFYNGWVYGDFIFIIEPYFFALGAPLLLCRLRFLPVRIGIGVALLAVLAACWLLPFVSIMSCLLVTTVTMASFWLALQLSPGKAIVTAIASSLAVAALFLGTQVYAKNIVRASLPASVELEDIVLTPTPANPLCWNTWRVYFQGDKYVAEHGTVAVLPTLQSAQQCSVASDNAITTAQLTALWDSQSPALLWKARYEVPTRSLQRLNRESCRFAAYLRFSRIPYWVESPDGGTIVGDLRYDNSPDLEFAEMALQPQAPCPMWVPAWIPPRQSLTR